MAAKKICRNEKLQLKGSLKKNGFDRWRLVTNAVSSVSGEEKTFFIEFYAVNPALSPKECVLGFKNRFNKSTEDFQYVLPGSETAKNFTSQTYVSPSFFMIKAGVLKNPDVDAAMAMHVHSGTPSNLILCGLGTSIGGCYRFRIAVKGTGCHGAMPELGVDPINIATHIYLSLQEITSREVTATKPAVITIGKFAGGEAPNIIPSEVIMEGTVRFLDKEVGEFIVERMNDIITSTAKLFRGEAELIELSSVPPLTNDDKLAHEVTNYMKDIVGEKAVVLFNCGGMGSEDFASYSYEVPSLYIMLGAGSKQENDLFGAPMHNQHVVFNEDILPTGAAVHAYSAIMWLKNNK